MFFLPKPKYQASGDEYGPTFAWPITIGLLGSLEQPVRAHLHQVNETSSGAHRSGTNHQLGRGMMRASGTGSNNGGERSGPNGSNGSMIPIMERHQSGVRTKRSKSLHRIKN